MDRTTDELVAAVDRVLKTWCVVDVGTGEICIAEAEEVVVDAGDGPLHGTRWVLAAGPAESFRAAAEELLADVDACRLADEDVQ